MNCRKCGVELNENANFCPKCGTPIASAQPCGAQAQAGESRSIIDDVKEEIFTGNEKVVAEVTGKVVAEIKKTAESVYRMLRNSLETIRDALPFTQELTYAEAMKYFIAHKDDSANIVKGAIIKEKVEGGFLVYQVFLNKDNNLVEGSLGRPLGYKRKVARLDQELLDVFKDEDLLIVE